MILDIIFSDGWVWFICLTAVVVIFKILGEFNELRDKVKKAETAFTESKLIFDKKEAEYQLNMNVLAREQFEKFKSEELETYRKVIREAAYDDAKGMLRGWIIDEEKSLRKDAVTRSMGVNLGKITEHLVPFSGHLEDFNPRDIRFIGSPIDLIIFDGITEKKDQINIYMVEIKTGNSKLSKRQKAIMAAIDNNRVQWLPVVVPNFKWDVPEEEDGE